MRGVSVHIRTHFKPLSAATTALLMLACGLYAMAAKTYTMNLSRIEEARHALEQSDPEAVAALASAGNIDAWFQREEFSPKVSFYEPRREEF